VIGAAAAHDSVLVRDDVRAGEKEKCDGFPG
jgi:hypothetical protein